MQLLSSLGAGINVAHEDAHLEPRLIESAAADVRFGLPVLGRWFADVILAVPSPEFDRGVPGVQKRTIRQ